MTSCKVPLRFGLLFVTNFALERFCCLKAVTSQIICLVGFFRECVFVCFKALSFKTILKSFCSYFTLRLVLQPAYLSNSKRPLSWYYFYYFCVALFSLLSCAVIFIFVFCKTDGANFVDNGGKMVLGKQPY